MLERFINTKAKTFVIFLFSIISILTFIISVLFACMLSLKEYGLLAGILLMILAVPFHIAGRKRPWGYIFSFLLNSIGCGFSASAYYASGDYSPDLITLIISAVPAAAILTLVYLMLQVFSKTKKVTVTIASVLNILMLIAGIVFWIMTESSYETILFSFGFFSLLLSVFYLCVFGVSVNHDERSVLRDVSYGSFGSFVIITVVVAFILSEGDILDGLDFDFGGGGKNKKKK